VGGKPVSFTDELMKLGTDTEEMETSVKVGSKNKTG